MREHYNNTKGSSIIFVCISLISFSLGMAYLLNGTYTVYHPVPDIPDWQGAKVITAENAISTAYFRRMFSLASKPEKAYFVVSGTDEVAVYVNGILRGTNRYIGVKVPDIIDITGLLNPGTNLIAVTVDNRAPSGTQPELIGRLELQFYGGLNKTLYTNREWKVSRVEDYQPEHEADWNSPDFDDLMWEAATVKNYIDKRPIYPVKVPELVYKTFPKGYWVWLNTANVQNATFLREFFIKETIVSGAWLGVSVSGNYSIMLNDYLLGSFSSTTRNMDLFDVGPYVRSGENSLKIHVESNLALPKFGVSGLINTPNDTLNINTDARWWSYPENTFGTSSLKAVEAIANIQDGEESSNIRLVFKEISVPFTYTLYRTKQFMVLFIMVLVISLLSLITLRMLIWRHDPRPFWKDLESLVLPFFFGGLIVAILLIISNDIRIGSAFPFQTFVWVSLAVFVLIWESLIAIERINLRNSDDG